MRLIALFYLFFAYANACSTSPTPKNVAGSILGKWEYAGSYHSAGGPLVWQAAEEKGIVEFADSGKLTSSGIPLFNDVTGYELTDSAQIKLKTAKERSGFLLYHYDIDSTGALNMYPLTYLCVEGCSDVFKRPSATTK